MVRYWNSHIGQKSGGYVDDLSVILEIGFYIISMKYKNTALLMCSGLFAVNDAGIDNGRAFRADPSSNTRKISNDIVRVIFICVCNGLNVGD